VEGDFTHLKTIADDFLLREIAHWENVALDWEIVMKDAGAEILRAIELRDAAQDQRDRALEQVQRLRALAGQPVGSLQ